MNNSLITEKRYSSDILILTLNKPHKRNALCTSLLGQFLSVLERAQQDNNLRILIIQGAGAAFCSGMDLEEATDHKMIEKSAHLLSNLFSQLYSTHLITIAAVHGAAIAGGAGLMAVCDLVIAAHETKIAFPETRRGLIASLIMTFLHRQIRERDLKELLLFGEVIDERKALHIGLINKIAPLSALTDEAILAAKAALKGAPIATCNTKKLIEKLYPTPFEEDLKKTAAYHSIARNSEEAREGIKAYMEKRNPSWFNPD